MEKNILKETILSGLTREDFLALAEKSNSISDLGKKIGYKYCSSKTIKRIKNKLLSYNFNFNSFQGANNSVLSKKEILSKIVLESDGFTEVLRNFNLAITGGNLSTLKKYKKLYSISITHFNPRGYMLKKKDFNRKWLNNEIFILNSPASTSTIKNRIIKENIFPYKCSCGLSNEWNNKIIVLQLEHKNGNNRDHRLENLEFLCPNCHSQTLTYAGRKHIGKISSKKVDSIIPSIQKDLHNLINELSSYNSLKDILVKYKKQNSIKNREVLNKMLLGFIHEPKVVNFYNGIQNSVKVKINFPPPEIVLEMVENTSYVAVAKLLNCSDNGVRKYLKKHKLL